MNISKHTSPLDAAITMSQMGKIAPVTKRVRKITDFHMLQYREPLIRDLVKIRREYLDLHGRKIIGEKYPVGHCLFIRDAIFDILKNCPRNMHPDYPDFSPFRIPLSKIWCIKHNTCMNNGIQYGNWIIDAANDTGNPEKFPVTISKIEDSEMRNPRDHEDLCQVFEKCWPVQCYPNVYFPELAPFFPVIFIYEGKVGFADRSMIGLDVKGVLNGFESAYRFLFQSSFAQKRLSDEHIQILKDKNCIPKSLHTEGPVNKHKMQAQFSRLRKLGPSKLAQLLFLYYKLLKENKQMVISGGL